MDLGTHHLAKNDQNVNFITFGLNYTLLPPLHADEVS